MPRKTTARELVASTEDVHTGLLRRQQIAAELERLRAKLAKTKIAQDVKTLEEEDARWDGAIKSYVIVNYGPSDGYEDEIAKVTKVVPTRRTWNVEKLERLLPRGMFKRVTTVAVDPMKLNEQVSAGKIDLDDISAAYEEAPGNPYVKLTYKTKRDGGSEADRIAEKLA